MVSTSLSETDRGQPIVMGIPGPTINQSQRDLIKRVQPGGFILFNRNLEHPAQVFDLISELYDICERIPIMTIDQEGGRVARLSTISERPVSGYALALSKDPALARRHGSLTGQLLSLFGFNLNLCPVVDYSQDEGADNSLRGRCLGCSPDEVMVMADAFLEGMEKEGPLSTAKHYPGYTYCGLDPHGDLPKINRTLEEMEKNELKVFRHFATRAPAFMVGHGYFPAWHKSPYPASISKMIVNDFLREEMKYDGLVMTDDLEMGAIGERYPAKEVSRLALEAGQDILLFCHNPACVEISWDTLCELPEELVKPAVDRIIRFKERLISVPSSLDLDALESISKATGELRKQLEPELLN
ncbi:MAG: glycoside hydrolase family 3 N-terminal domain-containing protein [Verrucomicrobiota bacterium]